jgi:hypothetical protein
MATAAQLAALRPAPRWQAGTSGNPSGRPRGVVYPVEHLRGLIGKKPNELREIAADQNQPTSRIMAARMALQAVDLEDSREQREAFNVVADRTTGKPTQDVRVEVTQADRDPAALIEDLRRRHALPGVEAPKRLPDTTSSTKAQ